ncbi:MAG TPA: S41 family peptidase [Bacilli bacterium]|nr:S41 family peptidase [Bacilli bacterium]
MRKFKNIFRYNGKITFNLLEVILLVVSFSFFSSELTTYINKKNASSNNSFSDVETTYNKIINDYYQDVNQSELADAAVDGMMNYLDEKYSTYLDSSSTKNLSDKLDGTYKGIGITIIKNDKNEIVVKNVFVNSPALDAGMKEGDIIKKVNDLEVNDDTKTEDISSIIQGNSTVTIIVVRDGNEITLNINIEDVSVPVVSTKMFSDNDSTYGYIYLNSFSSTSYDQFKSGLENLESNNINGLIIDLRGNSGGYLDSCTNILNLFMKKGKVLYSLDSKSGNQVVYDTTSDERHYNIAVLIDSNSASASEILASSLKESYGAILVGTTSYGKGKVQQTSNLSDSTMIKYTSATWYTPLGNSIDGVGLVPGFYVKLSSKYAASPSDDTDDQLKKAIEVLDSNY